MQKFLKSLLIFSLIFAWIFSGWPRIDFEFQDISFQFPPKVNFALAGSQSFVATSTGTSFIVPGGVTTLRVKCWGAGGGGGGGGLNNSGGVGGGGGFAGANITVTGGETLTVRIGGAGGAGINDLASNGDDGGGGGGGGYSAVLRGSTFLIQCGGGGGGGSASAGGETGGPGGAGGGLDGVDGTDGANSSPGLGKAGLKGTSTAGGAGGNDGTGNPGTDGAADAGGAGGAGGATSAGGAGGENGGAAGGGGATTNAGAGGGGAGRFGGGGGESGVAEGAGGGGGGSDLVTGSNTVETAGSGTTPGNNTDPDYTSPAGTGGNAGPIDADGSAGRPGQVVLKWDDSLTQSAYRWFSNSDSTDVGSAAGINTPIIAPKEGAPIRLRLLLEVGGVDIASSGTTSKMQVGEKPAGGCSAATFADIDGTTGFTWIDNSTPADGAALTANSQDPRHAATSSNHVVINQTYNESDTFTNSQGIVDAGSDMLFDFSLSVSTTSIDTIGQMGKTYCFRAVQAGGGSYAQAIGGGYDVYPELTLEKPDKMRLRGHVRLRNVRLR